MPCVIWRGTELVLMGNRLMGEERRFVMMRLVKLSMMQEMKIISLSGQGQIHFSKRYRAQCSKEDAVRRILISSEGSG